MYAVCVFDPFRLAFFWHTAPSRSASASRRAAASCRCTPTATRCWRRWRRTRSSSSWPRRGRARPRRCAVHGNTGARGTTSCARAQGAACAVLVFCRAHAGNERTAYDAHHTPPPPPPPASPLDARFPKHSPGVLMSPAPCPPACLPASPSSRFLSTCTRPATAPPARSAARSRAVWRPCPWRRVWRTRWASSWATRCVC